MLTPEELQVLEALLARARQAAALDRSAIAEELLPGDVVQLRPGADPTWETSLLLVQQTGPKVRGVILRPHRGGCREAWWAFSPPEPVRIGHTPFPEPAPDVRAWCYEPPCPLLATAQEIARYRRAHQSAARPPSGRADPRSRGRHPKEAPTGPIHRKRGEQPMKSDTRAIRAIAAVACPRCNAWAGSPCFHKGVPTPYHIGKPFCHSERMRAWVTWKEQQPATLGAALAEYRKALAGPVVEISHVPQIVVSESPGPCTTADIWLEGELAAVLELAKDGSLLITYQPPWGTGGTDRTTTFTRLRFRREEPRR